MLNRVKITIDGFDYTVVSEDDEEYIQKNAALVDQTIKEAKAGAPLSQLTTAVLAAMNIADKYFKAEQSADDLRRQVSGYASECSRLNSELMRLKKQLDRQQK